MEAPRYFAGQAAGQDRADDPLATADKALVRSEIIPRSCIMVLSSNADLAVSGRRWRSGFLLKTLGDSVHGNSITTPVVKHCRYILDMPRRWWRRRYDPSGHHLVERYLAMLRQNAMQQVEVRVAALLCASPPFGSTYGLRIHTVVACRWSVFDPSKIKYTTNVAPIQQLLYHLNSIVGCLRRIRTIWLKLRQCFPVTRYHFATSELTCYTGWSFNLGRSLQEKRRRSCTRKILKPVRAIPCSIPTVSL
eukprot:COSAG02_NODE_1340_length_13187_cov_6.960804_13_plen_249_part_00